MLVKLMPEQVAKYWDQINYAVYNSFPPIVQGTVNMNKVLFSLEQGSMVAWASVDASGKMVAIVTTTIQEDFCTESRSLLIYSVFGVADMIGRQNWKDGFETLKGYAKKEGCSQIIGYTRVDAIKRIAKYFGADIENTLIALSI